MFEQTDNQKKLEELDLDAVLEKAEDYKVEQPEGTDADGGEEFLRSFDFVDVRVDDLSWDDIIPKEQLEELKKEEQRQAEEKYLCRSHRAKQALEYGIKLPRTGMLDRLDALNRDRTLSTPRPSQMRVQVPTLLGL